MALFDGNNMVKSKVSNEMCEERKVDKNGRCPGEAGYYPPNNKAPKDFAEFQVRGVRFLFSLFTGATH